MKQEQQRPQQPLITPAETPEERLARETAEKAMIDPKVC